MLTVDEENEELKAVIDNLTKSGINVRCTKLHDGVGVRVKIVVADRAKSMVVELNDDSRESFTEAVGGAIYSTSRPKVMSYVTIFDSFWDSCDLYETVKAANEKLTLQETLQRQFIDIAAHELKTPVQPIVGMADILNFRFEDQKNMKTHHEAPTSKNTIVVTNEDVDIIVRNARRLERLTSDILDVARLESGSFMMNRSEFELDEVISDSVEYALESSEARENNTQIVFEPKDHIVIHGDKERIAQVIQNLLSNATKFSRDEKIMVLSEMMEDDSHAVVSVIDQGQGIDQGILPRLFTKFATKSHKGTGLGLYISKSIVEAHCGKIWARNNASGKGATFSFSIPMRQK
jgi:signal transduction histidine kinase